MTDKKQDAGEHNVVEFPKRSGWTLADIDIARSHSSMAAEVRLKIPDYLELLDLAEHGILLNLKDTTP